MDKYKILRFDSLTSSNDFIKDNLDTLDEYSVIVPTVQTNGKGRLGRTWLSTSDNLMFSILVKPNVDMERLSLLSLVMGASVASAIEKITNLNFDIKWPNDILYNDKKVCGILEEGRNGNIIIGVGVNINQLTFDEEIKNKATSLKLITNREINKDNLLEEIITKFDYYYNMFIIGDDSYIKYINQHNYLKNKEVKINNGNYKDETFKCICINQKGELVLQDKNFKLINICSNEVTLNNSYK